ncbi:hypothetical protein H5410_039832 [Solanum commersonii]|uniref:Uncharacterized protein n=1 Tax=Solanum commersonii TaxID=4109 RepID=A0A9J5XQS5_SOLCO|nr:hypothetical protein H5410_039832 [Solanum commersonii]
MDVRYDLVNHMSWSRGANGCIFKSKRVPKKEKPNLLIFVHELILKGEQTHFKVQTSPKTGNTKFADFHVL